MSAKGRTEKSLMNVLTGVFGQFFSYLLSFVIRTVFISTLGEIYLGLNGLYSNILSVLNLTELGLGTAIVIELYRTVAQKDEEKTKQYLQLYKKAYLAIGVIILVAGLAITPFLQYFVNDHESLELINYRLVFVLYLINTVFSYFFFAYRQSILQANQEEYRSRIVSYGFKFVEMILQVIFLLVFRNIYVYLIIPIVIGCASTIVRGILAGRWYPIVKMKPAGKLSREEIKTTWRNIMSVAVYKISGTVINSTDNIIISSYISIVLTGFYSNYLILVAAVQTILEKIFSAFTASLGNLNVAAGDDLNKKYQVFNTMGFLNFWLYGFCGVCLYVLFTPFIKIWIGERYLLSSTTEFVIVLNFLITGFQQTVGTHRAAYGLFYRGKFRPIFSIIVNIVTSIVLVQVMPAEYGVVAVLLGTIISTVGVSWWYDTLIVHKCAFGRSPAKYYIEYWLRIVFVVANCLLVKWICSFIHVNAFVNLLIYAVLCIVVFHGTLIAVFSKTPEFQNTREVLGSLISGLYKRVKRK